MKKNKWILFVAVTTAGVLFVTSCAKDDESAGGNDRDKFLGAWITTSTGSVSGTLNFTMNITAGSSSPTQIKIENFDAEGSGLFRFADVGGNALSITQQSISGDTISGSGTYNSNNTLSFTYTIRDGQTVENRTATAHK
ncbi:MAG TPA: hypothetical protein VI757_04660 [Bacteroidia bacterium]|nr:hypothetical protein [Bacteroidia bacterium]